MVKFIGFITVIIPAITFAIVVSAVDVVVVGRRVFVAATTVDGLIHRPTFLLLYLFCNRRAFTKLTRSELRLHFYAIIIWLAYLHCKPASALVCSARLRNLRTRHLFACPSACSAHLRHDSRTCPAADADDDASIKLVATSIFHRMQAVYRVAFTLLPLDLSRACSHFRVRFRFHFAFHFHLLAVALASASSTQSAHLLLSRSLFRCAFKPGRWY